MYENLLAVGVTEEELEEQLNWTQPVIPENSNGNSSEIPVEGFGNRERERVESHMMSLAKSLHSQLSHRVQIWPLILSSMEAFAGESDELDIAGIEMYARDKLKAVFDDLSETSREQFDFHSCLPAYIGFLKFTLEKKQIGNNSLEKIWKAFWNTVKDQEMYDNFIELFQFIQIKSYSEAICETVGSIMYIHHGCGRNIRPSNLIKEIYL